MKANHILSFTLSTFNIVWGKLGGGVAQLPGWLGLWSLQAKAPFPAVVELEVENLPPPGVDS